MSPASHKTGHECTWKKTKWRISKWRMDTGILLPLMILNVASTSGLEVFTTRVLASILGYPTTCTFGSEVLTCSLSLTCWLRGGTRVRGCGGNWLLACCVPNVRAGEEMDNSIQSSEWKEWKYKAIPSPPKLRVPSRSALPSNVFRRRVDDDDSQADCGIPSSRLLQKRIIGGREARFAEFPWQAHIRISEFQCGGVLVSRWYVATAAHCVSRARLRDISVWLGALDTTAGTQHATKLGVVQKILHPLFKFRATQPDRYDIALLRLSSPVTYAGHIRPICLPGNGGVLSGGGSGLQGGGGVTSLRGRAGVVAGWGKTRAGGGAGAARLRAANVPILSTEQCIEWHQSKQILVEIHSEMICAGHSDGHQDACLGDSGGPLIVEDNSRYYLVGITSAGFGCGVDHQPGIYHNVLTTVSWLRSHTEY